MDFWYKQLWAYFKLLGIWAGLAIMGSQANAATHDKSGAWKVTAIGSQGGPFFALSSPATFNCQWGYFYITGTEAQQESMHDLVMSAALAGKTVTRIVYDQASSGGLCNVSLLIVQMN